MTVRIDGTNSTANPAITGADTDTGLQLGTDEIQFVTGGTNRATVESDGDFTVEQGDLNLSDGNLVVASGHGIDFSPQGASNVNLLDDYEEGTFTVTDATNTVTFTSNRGHYVKIGGLIYVQFSINVPSTTSTTRLEITLPFASSVNAYFAGGGFISYTSRTTDYSYLVSVENSGSKCYIYETDNLTAPVTLADFSSHRIDAIITYPA